MLFDAAGQFIDILKSGNTDAAPNVYTIENLSSGTTYYYTLETLGTDITRSGEFTTTGEPNGVVETRRAASLPEIVGDYNILGVKLLQEPASGVYIIMYDDGTTKKVTQK